MMKFAPTLAPILALLLPAAAVFADPVQVNAATATQTGDTWRFDVTVTHPDTGWDHYADGWRIEKADGTVLGLRELTHPHVTEQPFTRSLGGVALPDGTDTVYIRARCSVDGWGTETFALQVP